MCTWLLILKTHRDANNNKDKTKLEFIIAHIISVLITIMFIVALSLIVIFKYSCELFYNEGSPLIKSLTVSIELSCHYFLIILIPRCLLIKPATH